MTEESRRDWRTIDAVIPASESLTNEIDLGGSRLVGIQMPAAWTAAAISFAVSPEPDTLNLMPARPGDILADADFAFWAGLIGTETVAASTTYWRPPKALRVDVPGGVENEGVYSPQVPVHRLTDYVGTVYLTGTVGMTVELTVAWYTGAGAFVSEEPPEVLALSAAWQRAYIPVNSEATAAYAVIRIRTETGAGAQGGTFYMDGVQLEADGGPGTPTAWIPGGGTWGTPTDAAGNQIAVVAPLVNEFITLAPEATAGFRFIRVRSGAFGAAVAQGAARTIMLVVRPI
jgi:hypothetical protein